MLVNIAEPSGIVANLQYFCIIDSGCIRFKKITGKNDK